MLSEGAIQRLIAPYLTRSQDQAIPSTLYAQLSEYLALLVRWNGRTNLTAIRDEEELVKRHFGESLFAATCLAEVRPGIGNLLDLGSGAGFPGIPMQLLWPRSRVVLAESQGKKAAFLREVVRTLGLGAEVWAARVEKLPSTRSFDVVTLRAVDQMDAMVKIARERLNEGGMLVELTTGDQSAEQVWAIPGATRAIVRITSR